MKIKLVITFFISVLIFFSGCTKNYDQAVRCYNEKRYNDAEFYLLKIPEMNKDYDKAKKLMVVIDSIKRHLDIEKANRDRIAEIEKEKQYAIEFKAQLKEDIKSLSDFKTDQYRGAVTNLQAEIIVFAVLKKKVDMAKMSKDKEVNNLGNTFKLKLIALQRSEFPRIRKEYGELLATTLWEQDIKVTTKGSGYSTLELEGGVFAANKNKQDVQNTLADIFTKAGQSDHIWPD